MGVFTGLLNTLSIKPGYQNYKVYITSLRRRYMIPVAHPILFFLQKMPLYATGKADFN
jgi:hypothetical protein